MSSNVVAKILLGTVAYSAAVAGVGVAAFNVANVASQPTDYYVLSEGSPFPILSSGGPEGEPLYEIEAGPYDVFPLEADLSIATVYVSEGASRWQVFLGKFLTEEGVEVRSLKEEFLEAGGTEEEWNKFKEELEERKKETGGTGTDEMYRTMLENSLNSSAAAALNILGEKVDYAIEVAGVIEDSPAEEAGLQVGDQIVAINNEPQSIVSLSNYLQTIPDTPLKYTVLRGDETISKTITAKPNPAAGGRLLIGITGFDVAELPFQVIFRNEYIGGASAGLVFSIAAYEYLTEEQFLVDGIKYGGTGGITPDGMVLPIDGLNQKISSANKSGHDYFFIPEEMCEDVRWNEEWTLTIIPVETLEDAISMLKNIKSERTEDLNECGQ
jgi:Lon-like protease